MPCNIYKKDARLSLQNAYLCNRYIMGLTGFDSGQKW